MTETDGKPRDLDTGAELDEFVAEHDRALVMFYTEGCSMCHAMVPVLGGVARSTDVAVATMNPRDDPPLIDEYDVRSVPKLLLFEGGDLVDTREEGFMGVDEVRDFLGESAETAEADEAV